MIAVPQNGDAGFTLLEVLVALAVLAVGAVSLLTATQTHVARISDVEARTVARWAADNRLSALRLGLDQPAVVPMLGQMWGVDVARQPTDDPDLERADIAVTLSPDDRVFFKLTGFVDTASNSLQVSQ